MRGWRHAPLAAGLLTCLAAMTASARTSEVILPDQVVAHDILAIGEDVQVYGIVQGDVRAIRGNVYVFGRVEGSVTTVLGRITVRGDSSHVRGDATVIGGNVWLQEGGSVFGQTRVSAPTKELQDPSYLFVTTRSEALILRLALVACWTLMALAAAFGAPTSLVRASTMLRRKPFAMLLVGALFHLSVLLAAILSTALISLFVGLPLLALLVVGVTILHALALGATFHAVGEWLAERASKSRPSGYAKILLGALMIGSLSLVPLLGEAAWAVTVFAGCGAILATRGRRRRREG